MTSPASTIARAPATRADFRADLGLAIGLFVGAILSAALGSVAGFYGTDTAEIQWSLLYGAALTLPLALRRRYPEIIAVVVSLAFFIGMSVRIPELYVGNIAVFIAFYTVGAWVDDRRRAVIVRAVITVGMFLWLLITTFQAVTAPTDDGLSREGIFSPFVAYMLIQFLVNVAFFGGAYYMGDRAYASALQRRALELRTEELERERELTAAQAVALDRLKIARELHDVVAHHVSAMGVQAGAARAVIEKDPDAARAALSGVESSARSALDELRHLLQTLRTADADTDEGSTLSLDDLEALVRHAEDNGLPTTFTVVGDPLPVPYVVQVNLYRIAQEALTNARRHAGPDAGADVRLRYSRDGVELEVTNTGRVATSPRPGLGLVGMRERAAASGGVLEAGPRPRGGFRVRAHVPLGTPKPQTPPVGVAVAEGASR
ncbi:sensor histidine kinase [Microbacterium sp. ET2]|uniref:sensor histidine kinase n=1 Tax=Microbacterium albipurpureum TaxID=3050384 RepID=UPI00259D05BD|nr:sensor histidine kinase [Microbacterium sp. ET2 (Ac-2212)]WJL94368.1 sensor histidine kinase [Microbacterium sp. ET2 (Ac-2212)]